MIEETRTPNGEVVYRIDGRLTASRVNPTKEAKQWIEIHRSEIERTDRIIVLGCGSGHHLVALAEAYPNKRQLVLDFEGELIDQVQKSVLTLPKPIDFHWIDREEQLLSSSLVRSYMRSPFAVLIHPSTNILHQTRYRELYARLIAREPLFFFEWVRRDARLAELFPLQALKEDTDHRHLSIKDLNEFTSGRNANLQYDTYLIRTLRELVK